MQPGRRLDRVGARRLGALWFGAPRLGALGFGALGVLLLPRPGLTADFSADVAISGAEPTRLYVADGKMSSDAPAGLRVADQAVRIDAPTGYFLIKDGTAVFVNPRRQIYTDSRQSTLLTQWIIPVDPANPCAQWQAAAVKAGVPGAEGSWRCEQLTAGQTARWRVTPPGQTVRECWIDSKLRFPVRIQMSDGASLSLENIRPGAQSPELFTLPASYHKLDPQALIERIKRSDVWAEPPLSLRSGHPALVDLDQHRVLGVDELDHRRMRILGHELVGIELGHP